MYKQESGMKYTYATTNISRLSVGEKVDTVLKIFIEAMTLPVNVQ